MQQDPAPAEVFPAELLATVGHEFRGPLTTIQGYATTLLRHEQRLSVEERQEFLRAISEASAHLATLVDRFLELAQLEAHAFPLLPVPLNLLALTREAITAAQQGHSQRLVLVPALSPQDSPAGEESPPLVEEATLSGDRRLLRMLLDVLLDNALTYSAPQSLVEVSLQRLPAAHLPHVLRSSQPSAHQRLIVSAAFAPQEAILLLRVRDHGIGIPSAHLGRIFQRFSRIDTSLTRERNGLGLGLALCQAIVTDHQGLLWVESTVGEGSTFAVALSCDRLPPAEQARPD